MTRLLNAFSGVLLFQLPSCHSFDWDATALDPNKERACEGNEVLLRCLSDQHINVINAKYSQSSSGECSNYDSNLYTNSYRCDSLEVTNVIELECGDKQECLFKVEAKMFQKELEKIVCDIRTGFQLSVEYRCEDKIKQHQVLRVSQNKQMLTKTVETNRSKANKRVSKQKISYCQSETINFNSNVYTFPKTRLGKVAKITCPFQSGTNVAFRCSIRPSTNTIPSSVGETSWNLQVSKQFDSLEEICLAWSELGELVAENIVSLKNITRLAFLLENAVRPENKPTKIEIFVAVGKLLEIHRAIQQYSDMDDVDDIEQILDHVTKAVTSITSTSIDLSEQEKSLLFTNCLKILKNTGFLMVAYLRQSQHIQNTIRYSKNFVHLFSSPASAENEVLSYPNYIKPGEKIFNSIDVRIGKLEEQNLLLFADLKQAIWFFHPQIKSNSVLFSYQERLSNYKKSFLQKTDLDTFETSVKVTFRQNTASNAELTCAAWDLQKLSWQTNLCTTAAIKNNADSVTVNCECQIHSAYALLETETRSPLPSFEQIKEIPTEKVSKLDTFANSKVEFFILTTGVAVGVLLQLAVIVLLTLPTNQFYVRRNAACAWFSSGVFFLVKIVLGKFLKSDFNVAVYAIGFCGISGSSWVLIDSIMFYLSLTSSSEPLTKKPILLHIFAFLFLPGVYCMSLYLLPTGSTSPLFFNYSSSALLLMVYLTLNTFKKKSNVSGSIIGFSSLCQLSTTCAYIFTNPDIVLTAITTICHICHGVLCLVLWGLRNGYSNKKEVNTSIDTGETDSEGKCFVEKIENTDTVDSFLYCKFEKQKINLVHALQPNTLLTSRSEVPQFYTRKRNDIQHFNQSTSGSSSGTSPTHKYSYTFAHRDPRIDCEGRYVNAAAGYVEVEKFKEVEELDDSRGTITEL